MTFNRDSLSSRAVTGMYYEALQADTGVKWLDGVSNYFTSDQPTETYPWLGMVPAMREWVGARQGKRLSVNGVQITNVHYESTLEFDIPDMRRDKTPQIRARIGEFAQRGQTHFASLISTLIANGASTVCYDGHYFFDTTHQEGDSGVQSNKISVTIAGLPATVHGSTTNPSPEEMQQAIVQGIAQMYGFKDDQGEPLNEMANQFLVMVPVGLSQAALAALSMVRMAAASTFAVENLDIRLVQNPRLTAAGWTTKFVVFRADGFIRPLIRQEETAPQLKVKDENSEFAFDTDKVQFGIDSWRGAHYGRWQGAVEVTLA